MTGILERETGKIRATVAPDRTKRSDAGSALKKVQRFTPTKRRRSGGWMTSTRTTVNHLETCVNGNIHTNSVENFGSLLKRGINGTYVSVEPFHLFRYVDEQAFRFNLNAAVLSLGLSREVVDTVQDERRNSVEEDSPGE